MLSVSDILWVIYVSYLISQPEPQRSLVQQICQQTGLNVQFAIQCLEGNGWDIGRALANFEQVKVRVFRLVDLFLC